MRRLASPHLRRDLAKIATFEKPPELGERWPRDGYFVPTRAAFMREFERRASVNTVGRFLRAFDGPAPTNRCCRSNH